MRNEENIDLNVRGKRALTSLLLTFKYLLSADSSIINENKKTHNEFVFFSNDNR